MIDNVFELNDPVMRPGVNDVTVNGVSVLTSGNVADIKAPEYDVEKRALTVGSRKSETVVGSGSTAFGLTNEASGNYSHAEGRRTTASGNYSHTEGTDTDATSASSHAEGDSTEATGPRSHAEGYHTEASGSNSHAEGYSTEAIGNNSHAEGRNTKAISDYSHAEGHGTIASYEAQHVFGTYNTEGAFAEIVGNGTSSSVRSNARTLDWSGNEWLAGGLTIGNQYLEVPTILSGWWNPDNIEGANNSLYIKYNKDTILPTRSYSDSSLGTADNLNIDFSQYEKIRVYINAHNTEKNYNYDEIINVTNSSVNITVYDTDLETDVTLGEINFSQSTYTPLLSQAISIDTIPDEITDVYFKIKNEWIKDTVSTDITNLETSISNLEDRIGEFYIIHTTSLASQDTRNEYYVDVDFEDLLDAYENGKVVCLIDALENSPASMYMLYDVDQDSETVYEFRLKNILQNSATIYTLNAYEDSLKVYFTNS